MEKNVFFRLPESEFERLEAYCEATGRTKSEVLREAIRKLRMPKKRSPEASEVDQG